MILHALTPGTTIKFPLSVKMSTVNQQKVECSIDVGPLALTLVSGKQTSAVRVDWVPYTPGGINYLESDHDVLSGIFTGCVTATYGAAKQRRVAHVHTGDDAGAGLDCKDLMKGLLGSSYAPIFTRKVSNSEYVSRKSGTSPERHTRSERGYGPRRPRIERRSVA